MRGLDDLIEGMTNEKKIVEVGTFLDDPIAERLHPTYHYKFITIIGAISSIKNAMLFVGNDKFDIRWLNKKLTKKELNILYNANGFKNVPNYWEIIKLIITDRLLADKELLDMMVKEYGQDIENIKFRPMLRIKSGIVTKTIPDDKLKKYGGILSNVSAKIINAYADVLTEEDATIVGLEGDVYKRIKNNIKKKVLEEAVTYSEGNILTNISDLTNDDLYEIYLK